MTGPPHARTGLSPYSNRLILLFWRSHQVETGMFQVTPTRKL